MKKENVMSELTKLYACLRIAQDDESNEEVDFWLAEIKKEKQKMSKCKVLEYPTAKVKSGN